MYSVESDAKAAFDYVNTHFTIHRSSWEAGLVNKRDGQIVAAALYAEYNGNNVFMHLAGEPGRRWLTREFLFWGFHYPFVQLGCKRMTCWVNADNKDSIRLCLHAGWKLEAVLRNASETGGHVYLYSMFRKDCRFISS